MARNTVAEQLVRTLVAAGVTRIYGVVGDSLNPVVDAVHGTDGIDWVHVRNEEAAAFAAAAQAQIEGGLAVCAGSCGPGNTHLVQGLYDAQRSGVPVLALASHIPSRQIGTGFFQETHPERLFGDVTEFRELVSHPDQMPRLARIAIQHALGTPGVAVLVLPGDVAGRKAVGGADTTPSVPVRATAWPAEDDVRELAARLNTAGKVALFCGAGVRGAHGEVMALAGRVKAPVGHTLRGKEWIQYDNPYDVGMIGLLGYGACYEALHDADLVLMLGCDFPYDDFLPEENVVQVDRDPRRLGRRVPLALGVHGDVAATLRSVLPLVGDKSDTRFLHDMLRRHERALTKVVEAYTGDIADRTPIHPEYVARVLDEVAPDDAVFTVDTGMNNVWAARYLTPNGRRRVIGSFSHGTMANALPHAIGAAYAAPGRKVVSLSGDGGLSMLLGELITVHQHRLPVATVVFNNSSLGMVRLEMMVDGLPAFQTDHPPVDYAAIAGAIGMRSLRVTRPDEVRDALREAVEAAEPVLVDVVTDPNALSIPSRISADQVVGFALSAGRTVLRGGVGSMIDLARSNLRNIPRP
ncbi:pyruvate dehydrogenase [Nocardiopsis changdeensis]|uniref:Pyruvate dehydrogenase n=1 Tax=Nocardiopsis changdeensis TaxID=2831969 RepID=A0ABX8BKI8_9ACTN|nr:MULTISPECIES: pyruvate dehydrogenase [Nocardiopsis]QUX22740.1 pyruvate dehydrogenase [Nocardiopsis changdeensis]QYX38683.1 pyruvate dehydrogenase [Nocardiopsis sp. MT53]